MRSTDPTPTDPCMCWNSQDSFHGFVCHCPRAPELAKRVAETGTNETRAPYEWALRGRILPRDRGLTPEQRAQRPPARKRRVYAFGPRVYLVAIGLAFGGTWGMVFGTLAGKASAELQCKP